AKKGTALQFLEELYLFLNEGLFQWPRINTGLLWNFIFSVDINKLSLHRCSDLIALSATEFLGILQ
ncbi:hypothetical protein, partial [Paenibacillus sonchi]|uniref:hypothetical protein n=1 Tax=Paenibacillus sonchi TaxID=373687 RepID=UPI001E555E1A